MKQNVIKAGSRLYDKKKRDYVTVLAVYKNDLSSGCIAQYDFMRTNLVELRTRKEKRVIYVDSSYLRSGHTYNNCVRVSFSEIEGVHEHTEKLRYRIVKPGTLLPSQSSAQPSADSESKRK